MKHIYLYFTFLSVFVFLGSCTKQDLKTAEKQLATITLLEARTYVEGLLENPSAKRASTYRQISIPSFREVVVEGNKYIIGDVEDKFKVDKKGRDYFERRIVFTKKNGLIEMSFIEVFGKRVSDEQVIGSFTKGKLSAPIWNNAAQETMSLAKDVIFYDKDYNRIFGSGRVKTFRNIEHSKSIDPSRFDLNSNVLEGVTSATQDCETYYVYYITYDVETYEVTSATFLYSYTTGNCSVSDDNASVQPDQGGGYGNIGNDDAEREEAEREYASQIRVTSKPYRFTVVGGIAHNTDIYSWTIADGLGISIAAHTLIIYDRSYVVTDVKKDIGFGVNDIITTQTNTALVGNLPTVSVQWNQMVLVPDITSNKSAAARLVVNCTGIITFRPLGDLANKLANIDATNYQVANNARFDFK
jgi:hypothetical protein